MYSNIVYSKLDDTFDIKSKFYDISKSCLVHENKIRQTQNTNTHFIWYWT